MFKHSLVEERFISAETTEKGRFYTTPEGNIYPSVTTFLSKVTDKSGLQGWIDRVGEEEAEHVKRRGATRGTALHLMCEKYVKNESDYARGVMPSIMELFKQIKPVLDRDLGTVLGIETPLYSDYLRLAGRCDMIAYFRGKRSIIDFKTTNWAKDMTMLEGYFIQESAYAIMFEELYGMGVSQLVTISAGESERDAQVVVEHRDKWVPKLLELRKQYG